MQLSRLWANTLSYIFHPLLITLYVFLIVQYLCPNFFVKVRPEDLRMWPLQTFFNTALYSGLVVLLLWKLDFAKDIFLRTQQERYVPLMASAIFYFWHFYVHHKNPFSPSLYNSYLLATFAIISLLFIFTMFTLVSMHSAAIMGAATFLIALQFKENCLGWPFIGLVVAIAVGVCIARLQLKAHSKGQIIFGVLLGIGAQLACLAFY
jgi:membrane-associated phospholipid phosphatase